MVDIPCICPPKADGEPRHPNGDWVELRERLDFRSALTARNAIVMAKTEDPDASVAEILAMLTETYLLVGIRSWTVVDAKGKPVEVSKPAIREYLLTDPDIAMTVGDAADELYAAAVMAPLVARGQSSSATTPTDDSTSATTGTPSKPPKPSKRSSTTTTPMGATATITPSLVGASSSSPNGK